MINATEPPETDNDDQLEYETTNKYGNFEVDDGYARGKSRKYEKEVKKTIKQFLCSIYTMHAFSHDTVISFLEYANIAEDF